MYIIVRLDTGDRHKAETLPEAELYASLWAEQIEDDGQIARLVIRRDTRSNA